MIGFFYLKFCYDHEEEKIGKINIFIVAKCLVIIIILSILFKNIFNIKNKIIKSYISK